MKTMTDYWYSKNPLLYLLLPIAYLYKIGYRLHRLMYLLGFKKIHAFNVPVIIVGNITIGGTGKTPFTIELANTLAQQGYFPGIVSRGYGGKADVYPQWVTPLSDPMIVGDEAVLITSRTQCPVVVAPKRADAITMLLEKYHCNIVICDDGLQHHALKRDLEIVLIDSQRGFGNGLCLPAGPLRQSIKKLCKVDFVVLHDVNHSQPYSMFLKMDEIYNLKDPTLKLPVATLQNKVIHAVAGIGNPARFFNSLRALNLNIKEHSFPDHHPFKISDFEFCGMDDIVIMTEKDAIKCRQFAAKNYWVLPVTAQITKKFIEDFLAKLALLPASPPAN